jgi:hypothetical protein
MNLWQLKLRNTLSPAMMNGALLVTSVSQTGVLPLWEVRRADTEAAPSLRTGRLGPLQSMIDDIYFLNSCKAAGTQRGSNEEDWVTSSVRWRGELAFGGLACNDFGN